MMMVVVIVTMVIMPVVIVAVMMIMIAVRPADMGIVKFEELRIILDRTGQIEPALFEDFLQVHIRPGGAKNACRGIDLANHRFHTGKLVRIHEVRLVEQHNVGKGDLVPGFRTVLEPHQQVLGIGKRDDRVEPRLGTHVIVHEEGLGNGCRIGKPGRFHHHCIEPARPLHQVLHHTDQVAAHRAADAAIVHFVDFLIGFHDEVVIDADLAELIDDHRIFAAMILGQNAVEQGRLARAQIAGKHGNGDLLAGFYRLGHSCLQIPFAAMRQDLHDIEPPMPNCEPSPDCREDRSKDRRIFEFRKIKTVDIGKQLHKA